MKYFFVGDLKYVEFEWFSIKFLWLFSPVFHVCRAGAIAMHEPSAAESLLLARHEVSIHHLFGEASSNMKVFLTSSDQQKRS